MGSAGFDVAITLGDLETSLVGDALLSPVEGVRVGLWVGPVAGLVFRLDMQLFNILVCSICCLCM